MKLQLVDDGGQVTELRQLGANVRLADDLHGLIVSVNLEAGRVQYSVAWIHNGTRCTAWLSGLELDARTGEVAP